MLVVQQACGQEIEWTGVAFMTRIKWFAILTAAWALLAVWAVADGKPEDGLVYAVIAGAFALLNLADR
jgi:hypothetical protein